MRKYIFILMMFSVIIKAGFAQDRYHTIKGRIVSESGQAIQGATVIVLNDVNSVQSNEDGYFQMRSSQSEGTLQVSHINYKTMQFAYTLADRILITMLPLNMVLDSVEVLHTGYYSVPKERSTGSFAFVGNSLLNRSTSTNVLQRLESIVPGLQFVDANATDASSIRIRGLATISSDPSPLIVLDNFPYDGDINNINPNDIENITVLKDAAAASIWGARAGNGVIVITTKSGKQANRTEVDYNVNFTVGMTPNLFYSQKWLPSAAVMDIEHYLFDKGGSYVTSNAQRPWPYYVELLQKHKDGNLSESELKDAEYTMANSDIRKEAMKYLYQGKQVAQHGLTVGGGTDRYKYRVGANYDKTLDNIIGNENTRWNLNFKNNIELSKNLILNAEFWYVRQDAQQNGIGLSDLAMTNGVQASSYLRLRDEEGNPLAIPHERRMNYYDQAMPNGLLDWHYRPLDEQRMNDYNTKADEIRMNTSLNIKIIDQLKFTGMYQFTSGTAHSTRFYNKDSYYVRDLVNKFTQADMTRIIPYGNILEGGRQNESVSHAGRAQLDYLNDWGQIHELTGLLGMDIREDISKSSPGFRTYNYDIDVLTGVNIYDYTTNYKTRPSSSAKIPTVSAGLTKYTDRYLSYFGNLGYRFREKYVLTGSVRWDGSNLFGVKTNQKGVPLWSVGTAWQLSSESFYKIKDIVEELRLSVTYGSAGNVNKNVSVYPTILYGTNTTTNLQTASIINVGNPSLKWEQVNTINTAVSFSAFGGKIDGEFAFYTKKAEDLIGESSLPPSTGINYFSGLSNQVNYANLITRGWDLRLKSKILDSSFKWTNIFIWSKVENKVTKFNTPEVNEITEYFWGTPPVIGNSKDALYAFPWWGLDHETGNPLVEVDGELGFDYQNFINTYDKAHLINAGVTVPTSYGSWRNSFSYKGIMVDVNIAGKFGSVFRRQSISPGQEYVTTPTNYHTDYFKRWTKRGDELFTNVPAAAQTVDPYLDQAYIYSRALITNGDFVRLADISFGYDFPQRKLDRLPLQRLRIYAYIKNLGLLWKANKNGIDPDYIDADYVSPATYSFGTTITF